MKMLLNKIEEIGLSRCASCPAYYAGRSGEEGEYDEGCSINRDIDSFCLISLSPRIIAEPFVNMEQRKLDEDYIRHFKDHL
ncbi:hypothetical protein C0431_12595 [bacterium]|nr:hypothetical protein [bacterium]